MSGEIRAELGSARLAPRLVKPGDGCGAECGEALLGVDAFVFPCTHAFHAACIHKELAHALTPRSPPALLDAVTMRRLAEEEQKLASLRKQLASLRSSSAPQPRYSPDSRFPLGLPIHIPLLDGVVTRR